MTLSFMALLVIPHLKLSDLGFPIRRVVLQLCEIRSVLVGLGGDDLQRFMLSVPRWAQSILSWKSVVPGAMVS